MSVKTIYKCDKCGKEQETSEQFWTIGVMAHPHGGSINTYSPFVSKDHYQQVCRPCLESYGIYVQTRDKEKVITPVTLEDLLIELIHETIDNHN